MILLTGCNGALGNQLAVSLLESGYSVRGYIRAGADLSLFSEGVKEKIEWHEGTLFDSYALSQALEGVDTVIHAAAVVSFSPGRTKEMYHTNVQGTANLVNESLVAGVKQFIHISSVAALGRPVNKEVIDETDLWVESDNNTHYAKSKYLAELEVFRGFEEGLQGFVLNPSVILSPGDIHKSSTKLFGYVLKESTYYTEGTLNYVDVRDVCTILKRLMVLPVSGERFILNGGSLPFKTFFEEVANAFGKKAPYKSAGSLLKGILWRIEYLRSLLTGSEPLITKETARMGSHHYQFDNSKIKDLLDYRFYTAEESVKWVCSELAKQPAVYNLLEL